MTRAKPLNRQFGSRLDGICNPLKNPHPGPLPEYRARESDQGLNQMDLEQLGQTWGASFDAVAPGAGHFARALS